MASTSSENGSRLEKPTVTITLSVGEYECLLMALGMATGLAMRENQADVAGWVMRLTDAINRDNPDWTEIGTQSIPPEFKLRHSDRETSRRYSKDPKGGHPSRWR
jgi:hypothetical protein